MLRSSYFNIFTLIIIAAILIFITIIVGRLLVASKNQAAVMAK